MSLNLTESDWLTGTDPQPMVRYLINTEVYRVDNLEEFPDPRTSKRKLRLFACACYHNISHFLPNRASRKAVQMAERFADGLISVSEFESVDTMLTSMMSRFEPAWQASWRSEREKLYPTHSALSLAKVVCWKEVQKAALYAPSNASHDIAYLKNPNHDIYDAQKAQDQRRQDVEQCNMLREIIGNPFREVFFDPKWRTETVIALAEGAYEERFSDTANLDIARLMILADALEEAGCNNDEIIDHLRGSGPHYRGCWALDLVLEKT